MDRRFPEPEHPDYLGQPQQRPGGWPGYPRHEGVPDVTLSSRSWERPMERGRKSFPRISIVWLLIAILLTAGASSFATVFVLRHPALLPVGRRGGSVGPPATPTVAAAEPTPTPAATTIPRGSLYSVQTGLLSRYNLQNSQQPVWSIQATNPDSPLILGSRLFFENEQSPGAYLEAVNVDTGQVLWQNTKYGSGFLLGSGNALYDAACYDTMNNTGTTICNLYGINASTGAQLWSYPLAGGSAWIALQNSVIYVVSYTNYFAVNATTGALIWQRNLFRYTDQNANMSPVVSGNVLSFASCNVTKQSRGAPGCYVYAFNTGSGAELWHMYTTASIWATPAIMNGVVYAGALNGTVYALDEQSGKELWTANVGGTVGQVLASAGIVYVETVSSDGQTAQIEALNAGTHKPLWGQSQNGASAIFQAPGQPAPLFAAGHAGPRAPLTPLSGGLFGVPFFLDRGLIYIHDTPPTIDVLNASNGSTVTEYNISGVYGFTVVTQ